MCTTVHYSKLQYTVGVCAICAGEREREPESSSTEWYTGLEGVIWVT